MFGRRQMTSILKSEFPEVNELDSIELVSVISLLDCSDETTFRRYLTIMIPVSDQ